jgi:hypothetical protein
MPYCTRPVATPKAPYSNRTEALATGSLLDLGELRTAASDRILGLPCAVSADLWERVREIPFAQLRTTDCERRLAHLIERAERALLRVRRELAEAFGGAAAFGFVLDFSVALPRCARDPRYGFARMHCGPDETGEICVTLAEVGELAADVDEEEWAAC